MAATSDGRQVIATTTGASDHIALPAGEHTLLVTAASWGSATLQIGDGTTFVDAQNVAGAVTFSANGSQVVAGGMCYRLNVASYSAAITMRAYPGASAK